MEVTIGLLRKVPGLHNIIDVCRAAVPVARAAPRGGLGAGRRGGRAWFPTGGRVRLRSAAVRAARPPRPLRQRRAARARAAAPPRRQRHPAPQVGMYLYGYIRTAKQSYTHSYGNIV